MSCWIGRLIGWLVGQLVSHLFSQLITTTEKVKATESLCRLLYLDFKHCPYVYLNSKSCLFQVFAQYQNAKYCVSNGGL